MTVLNELMLRVRWRVKEKKNEGRTLPSPPHPVRRMMWTPESVKTGPLMSPTLRAKEASSKGFCIWPEKWKLNWICKAVNDLNRNNLTLNNQILNGHCREKCPLAENSDVKLILNYSTFKNDKKKCFTVNKLNAKHKLNIRSQTSSKWSQVAPVLCWATVAELRGEGLKLFARLDTFYVFCGENKTEKKNDKDACWNPTPPVWHWTHAGWDPGPRLLFVWCFVLSKMTDDVTDCALPEGVSSGPEEMKAGEKQKWCPRRRSKVKLSSSQPLDVTVLLVLEER